jgi:hypothetical protein
MAHAPPWHDDSHPDSGHTPSIPWGRHHAGQATWPAPAPRKKVDSDSGQKPRVQYGARGLANTRSATASAPG